MEGTPDPHRLQDRLAQLGCMVVVKQVVGRIPRKGKRGIYSL